MRRTPAPPQEGRNVQREPVQAVPSASGSLNGSKKWRKKATEESTVEGFPMPFKTRHGPQIPFSVMIRYTAAIPAILLWALDCRITNVRTAALRLVTPEKSAVKNQLKNFIIDTTSQDRTT